MGMSGISKSQVSRLCEEIDDKVKAFLSRPIEDDWPYLWIDAHLREGALERLEFFLSRFSAPENSRFLTSSGMQTPERSVAFVVVRKKAILARGDHLCGADPNRGINDRY
jgi:hypothetical protein